MADWGRISMLAAALVAGGCASVPLSTGSTAIQLSEAPRWISAVELTRYGCAGGVMGCTSDGGRLSERRCRCPDAR